MLDAGERGDNSRGASGKPPVKCLPAVICNDSVIYAALDDEVLLLNVEDGVYFGLDAIGARVWELLGPGATEEEIVAQLLEEYDVPISPLRADIREFLGVLASRGLTREVGD